MRIAIMGAGSIGSLYGAALVMPAKMKMKKKTPKAAIFLGVFHDKAMFRRYVEEVLNPGKYDRIEEFVAPEYGNYSLRVDGEPEVGRRGPEACRESHLRFRAAFPDLHIGIQHILGEGDWIAVNTIWSGTHRGDHLGIAPTGKSVVWGMMLFRRISNGRMVEGWVTSATHRQLQALGVDLSRYGL